MGWQKMRVAGASAVALLMIAGCAAGGNDAPAVTQPLRVVGQFEFHSLDPSTAGGFFTRLQVVETLVDADVQGVLQPGLAESWSASADGLSWTFALRPDAHFHDGTAVTAEVAAAALTTAQGKAGTPLATVPLKAISAEGNAVRVDLAEPFAPLPAVLAHTSTQILAPSSYGPDQAVTKVVGSGPYQVSHIEPPAKVELAAFEQWHGEKPDISEVTYQAVGRAESRA